jgi:hypothetical protein
METDNKAAPTRAKTIDSPDFKRMLFAWAEAAPGQPSEDAYRAVVEFVDDNRPTIRLPWVTLNAHQLKAAAQLANPEGDADPVQDETVVTIWQREPFTAYTDEVPEKLVDCPAGVYLSFDDMPEEGIQLLSPGAPNLVPSEHSAG